MAAYEEGAVRLSNRTVGQAIEMAWLGFLCDINNIVEDQWQRHHQSLEREIKDLKGMLEEERNTFDDLKHDLEKEHEVTKSLEQEIKMLKENENVPHKMGVVHHSSL